MEEIESSPNQSQNENFTGPTPEIQAKYDIEVNLGFHGEEGHMQTTYSPFFWPTTSMVIHLLDSQH
jgi:hypothetical protein